MSRQELWDDMLAKSFSPREWFLRSGPREEQEDDVMWVYRKDNEGFSVGFYSPDGEWNFDTWHQQRDWAASRVSWLNGGGTANVKGL